MNHRQHKLQKSSLISSHSFFVPLSGNLNWFEKIKAPFRVMLESQSRFFFTLSSLDIDRNLSQLSRVWVCKSNISLKHHSGTFWWRNANAINISLFGFIDAQQALEKLRRLPHLLLRPLLKREWRSVKTLRNMNMWTSSSVIRNSSNNQWQYTYTRFTSSDFLPSVPQYHYPIHFLE